MAQKVALQENVDKFVNDVIRIYLGCTKGKDCFEITTDGKNGVKNVALPKGFIRYEPCASNAFECMVHNSPTHQQDKNGI